MSNTNLQRNFIDKVIRDRRGQVVLWQSLNLPIIVWAAAKVLAKIFSRGTVHSFFEVIAFGALFTWAWLELFQGVNYFRRGLGLIVLVLAVWNKLV